MTTDLKPCPRCGSAPKLREASYKPGRGRRPHPDRYWYRCPNVLACPSHQDAATPDEAAALWNARTTPALPTAEDLQAIIARNAKRREIKATMYERPYTVEYDHDYDDAGVGGRFAYQLTSGRREPSALDPTRDALRCAANFTETSTDIATAEGVAFCCNDTPEDDISTLLALITTQSATIAEDNAALAEADRADTQRRRAILQWLDDYHWQLSALAQQDLRAILGGDHATTTPHP